MQRVPDACMSQAAAADMQVQKVLVLVPGKALAGIVELCRHSWAPEVQQLVPEVHQMVVQSLRQQGAYDAASEHALQAKLSQLRHLAAHGWQTPVQS